MELRERGAPVALQIADLIAAHVIAAVGRQLHWRRRRKQVQHKAGSVPAQVLWLVTKTSRRWTPAQVARAVECTRVQAAVILGRLARSGAIRRLHLGVYSSWPREATP